VFRLLSAAGFGVGCDAGACNDFDTIGTVGAQHGVCIGMARILGVALLQ
jgi:hypothetical protein